MTETPITFDPGPCGRPIGRSLCCGQGHLRCSRCTPIRERIGDVFCGIEETGVLWPAALAMSCAWAALLGRAADREVARVRLAARFQHKRRTIEALLASGPVNVRADARRADVAVPDRLRDRDLVLRFGRGLTPPIHDLAVDARGISGTLTFGGQPHHCALPWAAVYAARAEGAPKGEGVYWSEDVPDDLVAAAARTAEAVIDREVKPENVPPAARRGHLRLVE